MQDEEIVEGLKKGENWAFEFLYKNYAGKIGSVAKAYLGSDDVDDVVQEVMFRIFKGIKKFKGDSKLSTWIYRITVNVCKDFLSRYKRRSEILADFTEDEETSLPHPPSDIDTSDVATGEIEYEKILEAMEKLPAEDRLLIKMRDIDGLSYEEISQILGKPVGSVKSSLHYARKKLRRLLEGAKE
ncbi:RNA polymerase sigma factor [Pseudothermotoga thermarum]|uniref:RNA polymerase, sigma-24 subunit, RpoE n=1 Tax=Pseudothermotoga thermarum DSM 5069 TaxID=688269 RepID=F7YYH5_9THEM|nr:RNA polymerase sigma factor [Pseudothermotoga thermarum]AEH51002.1 RNA polymerase, sigma-24 subunit, RpoE [Pseudothermotoga thermarum DSM 5069]